MALRSLLARSMSAPMIVRAKDTITAGDFAAAVLQLAEALPPAEHIINLCEQRFHFLLGFCAAGVRGQLTLLPPNQTPGVLQDLKSRFDNCIVLTDRDVEQALKAPLAQLANSPEWLIDEDRVVALAFTSGSTGAPQSHTKTWRTLSMNAQLAAAEVLGGVGSQLVATVPPQHVYGLETSAISALAADCTVFDGKPFFPQDVRAALQCMSTPRTLITTPTHLRALLEARVELPSLARIVSATAPLAQDMAEHIERMWNTQVFEIYGCTEAGIMARRRSAISSLWQTFSGGEMQLRDNVAYYSAPQLPEPVPLQDILELTNSREFHLRGRTADMIKVGGKRASLQALTRALLAVEGVRDGVIFVPRENARPAALVVAPDLNAAYIHAQLSEHIDAVFLPRPLLLIDELPRNAVGKLPHEVLVRILREHMKTP